MEVKVERRLDPETICKALDGERSPLEAMRVNCPAWSVNNVGCSSLQEQ